jgi:hypothetical protein
VAQEAACVRDEIGYAKKQKRSSGEPEKLLDHADRIFW